MLFLYELCLKILSKLKLGDLFFPLLRIITKICHVNSLPNVKRAKHIIYKNTYNKDVKDKSFHFYNKNSNKSVYDLQIIIPAYNSAKYIQQCLTSIFNQKTIYRYQIIIVNDGSTDGTSKILKRYANNPLIKIINEKNYGSSVARDTGLEFVNSEHIMFVDSDDKLAPGAIQKLLSNAYRTNADVTLGGSARLFNDGRLQKWFKYHNTNNFSLRMSNDIEGGPCAKIFKSILFKDIYFPIGYTFEDMMLFFLVYPKCRKISAISSIVYFYRDNPSSISHKVKFNNASVDSFLLLMLMIKSLNKYDIQINQYIYNTFLNQVQATGMRNIYVNTKIQKSIFVLICCLYNKYFKHFSTDINSNIPLEKSLKNKDYMNYILYCIMK